MADVHDMSSRKMARKEADPIQLSLEEYAFCVLVQSHAVACQAFSDVVINAIRLRHPTSWIETIGGCFSSKLRGKIKAQLARDGCLTEIYAICKVINLRLHDVVQFCGGKILTDPREKERFSFQVYGVEEARNWAFHGEGVSVKEVATSTTFLVSISQSLKCEEHFQMKLSELLNDLLNAMESNGEHCHRRIDSSVLSRNFLQRSFVEIENEFHQLCRTGDKTIILLFGRKDSDGNKEAVQVLMKRIRKETGRGKDCPKQIRKILKKLQGGLVCTKILSARNKLAHFQNTGLEEVEMTLSYAQVLLEAFGLCCRETCSAMKDLPTLRKQDLVKCAVVNMRKANEQGVPPSHERLLRPGCPHFVGRDRELQRINTIFNGCGKGERAIVLYGPAGIGKSYLATRLVCERRESFPNQSWLSCSSVGDFVKDIPRTVVKGFNVTTCSKCGDDAHEQADDQFCDKSDNLSTPNHLVVLDDVCLDTVKLVCQLVQNSAFFFVITTRGSFVKLQLQEQLKCVSVFSLEPFSLDESCQLLFRRNAGISPDALSVWKNVLDGLLGNIPLCVGIFSSWLNKKQSSGNAFLVDIQTSESSDLVKSVWSDIEEECPDRFHRRGLNGVVEMAMESLQHNPQGFFVLGVLCHLARENIPWEVFRHAPSRIYLPSFGTDFLTNGLVESGTLMEAITKMFANLYPSNKQFSMCCRFLEEVGLVHFNSTSSTIHIHGLTLSIVQRALEDGLRRYVSAQYSNVLKTERELSCMLPTEVERVFLVFFDFVMFAFIVGAGEQHSTQMFLGNMAAIDYLEFDSCRTVYRVFTDYLEKQAHTVTTVLTDKSAAFPESTKEFVAMFVFNLCLIGYKAHFMTANDYTLFSRLMRFCSQGLLKDCSHIERITQFGKSEEKLSLVEMLQLDTVLFSKLCGLGKAKANSYKSAAGHLEIAIYKQRLLGEESADLYLQQASVHCPILKTPATINDLIDLIIATREKRNLLKYNGEESLFNDRLKYLDLFIKKLSNSWSSNIFCCARADRLTVSLLLLAFHRENMLMTFEKMSINTIKEFYLDDSFYKFTQSSGWAHNILLTAIDVNLAHPHSHIAVLIEHRRMLNRLDLSRLKELISVNVFVNYYIPIFENMRLAVRLLMTAWDTGHFEIDEKPLITGHGDFVERSKNEAFSPSWTRMFSSTHFVNIGNTNNPQAIHISAWETRLALWKDFDAEDVLQKLVVLFERLIFALSFIGKDLRLKRPLDEWVPTLIIGMAQHIACLCVFVDESVASQVSHLLSTLTSTCDLAKISDDLTTTLNEAFCTLLQPQSSPSSHYININIGRASERKAYLLFKEAKRTYSTSGKKEAASRLKHITINRFRNDLFSGVNAGENVSLFSQLTQLLEVHFYDVMRRVHTDAKNYLEAELYTKAALVLKRRIGSEKIVWLVNHHVEYAKLLVRMKRWSEGAEQASLAKTLMASNFGEDYSNWLPNVPECDFEKICESFQDNGEA